MRKMTTRMFPLQTSRNPETKAGPLSIPWNVAEMAYAEYARQYGTQQSLARLAERGGFSWGEMDMLYPEWREKVDAVNDLRADRARLALVARNLEEQVAALAQGILWYQRDLGGHGPPPQHNLYTVLTKHGTTVQTLAELGREG